LIHSGRGLDAKHVMVDGELLLENRRFTRVDDLRVAEVLATAGERGRALAQRAGLSAS
jgi:5-methylthioadenosine/S-adenosylhomocysteine deaminase